jgi:membrane protease YdiL (CAAX protease family)
LPETPVDTEVQEFRGPSRRRILAVVGLVVFIVAISPVIARTLYTVQSVSRNAYMTELMLPVLSLFAAAGGILALRQAFGKQAVGIVWFGWNRTEVAGAVLLVITIPIACNLIDSVVCYLGFATRSDRVYCSEVLGVAFFIAVTIRAAFATPFIEELFWRGSVQTALTPAVGAVGAWVFQAALFAGMHLRPLGGFMTMFAFGLMTGLWRWRRRTLLPIILAHVALNFWYCAVRWPGWLEMCQIKITHDYSADRIELSRPSPYDPNEDARYDYERAQESFAAIPSEIDAVIKKGPMEWTPRQRDAIRRWVDANAQALAHLAQGASKLYYCPDYQIESAHLPTLAAARSLAFALNARIRLHAMGGREEEMVCDIVTLYRFGTHFGGKKVLVHQLVGAAIRGMTSATARKVLAHHSLSSHTLDTLCKEFQAFSDTDDHVMDFSPERLFCLNEIQKTFTDDGRGHGYVPEAVLKASPGMTSQQKEAFLKLERYETTQSVEAFFEHIRIAARKSPWELHDEPNGVTLTLQDLMHQNAFLDVMGPAYVKVMDTAWREKTELDAVLAGLAILRYEADRGRLPESLEKLVSAGYLERVPRDSYSSGPFIYQRTREGFRLYSCGVDFDDDGGTHSKWGMGENGGDQVFWPVEDYR